MSYDVYHREDLPEIVTDQLDLLSYKVQTWQDSSVDFPSNFDCRQKWPKYISGAMNQEDCGSCWAFGVANMLSDRIRIVSNGEYLMTKVKYKDTNGKFTYNLMELSPHFFASCSVCEGPSYTADFLNYHDECNYGCSGGIIQSAILYVNLDGLPTTECEHIIDVREKYICPVESEHLNCPRYFCSPPIKVTPYNCDELTGTSVALHYHIETPDRRINDNCESMMMEIQNNGPIVCGIKLYPSFAEFFKKNKTGIYTGPKPGEATTGGHAINCIGWGVKNGVKYWLCRNSWGTSWGDNGFFRLERGKNLLDMECDAFAATPILPPRIISKEEYKEEQKELIKRDPKMYEESSDTGEADYAEYNQFDSQEIYFVPKPSAFMNLTQTEAWKRWNAIQKYY